MKPIYIAGFLVLALIVAAASAATFTFEGATGSGQYSGTLVVGDDGTKGLSLAAVSGGTITPVSQGTLNLEPGPIFTEPVVSQDLSLEAEAGEAFAGCSVIGPSGDKAWTATLVSGGSASVEQEAGTLGTEVVLLGLVPGFDGVYASQHANGSTFGSSLSSASVGMSARGDRAIVEAATDGPFDFNQTGRAGTGFITVTGTDVVFGSGAYARQDGDFGSLVVNNGYASATGTDAEGDSASAWSEVHNGSLYFDQEAAAGTICNLLAFLPSDTGDTGAAAWQNVTLDGTGGKIATGVSDRGGSYWTWTNLTYDGQGNVSSLNGITNGSIIHADSGQDLPGTDSPFVINSTLQSYHLTGTGGEYYLNLTTQLGPDMSDWSDLIGDYSYLRVTEEIQQDIAKFTIMILH
ncbi:hypothetical protein J2741_001538 [Methanolinea mesophila]|uniref:hypothetical protein n=1 Tax=Methanolinea mesophila TaxID=547055 RepID=UPI001AE33E13|nr:hypothetical protein [Methanolinea mesophila]MBP1928991.1 hypothetical protein [Methanolinea mesophila]